MARRSIALIFALVGLLLAAPVQAITGGTEDADGGDARYPNVGALIVSYPAFSDIPTVWCSGTLVSPTQFLTAAHCVTDNPTTGFDILGISFAAEPVLQEDDPEGEGEGKRGDTPGLILIDENAQGVIQLPEGYPGPSSDPLDIAIITIPAQSITPAELPELYEFDRLAQQNGLRGQEFTAVGYGSSGREHEPGTGSPEFIYPEVRMFAASTFRALNAAWLRLSMNPSTDDGGTCYGDSGGPNFLGSEDDEPETDIIAGITITGDTPCRATNVIYRLDSLSAQEFLYQQGVIATDPSPDQAAPAVKTKTDKAKADKGKAKKAGKDGNRKNRRGHRR